MKHRLILLAAGLLFVAPGFKEINGENNQKVCDGE